MTNDFWSNAEQLVREHEVIIDRPKGSRHPRFSEVSYPLDYGYLAGTRSGDGQGVDVWIGSLPGRAVTAIIITADVYKQDAEVKLLLGCTPDEAKSALKTHRTGSQGATLVLREWGNDRQDCLTF